MCIAEPENIDGRNPFPLWANIARDRGEWGLWFRADYAWVMRMKYEDPRMEAYFNSLPSKVRAFINNSRADISTPGELMLIGEHFRKSFGGPGRGPPGQELICFLLDSPEHRCVGVRGLISCREKMAALVTGIYREAFAVCGSVSTPTARDSVAFCEKKFP